MNKNLVILILGLASVGLAAGLVYFNLIPALQIKNVSPEKAGELALAYINKNILGGAAEATLEGKVLEESGLYKMEIKVGSEKVFSYMTKDGKTLFPQWFDLTKTTEPSANQEDKSTLPGNFSLSQNEVCLENGKPLVYFFGADWCPHCQWEHPIIKEIAEKFAGQISFHDNLGTEDDKDVFSKYSTGGIPTVVLGCKYFRVGSGENQGEEKEKEVLTSFLCELTGNQPSAVCVK